MPKQRCSAFPHYLVLAAALTLASCGQARTDAELVDSTLRIDIDTCRPGNVRATGIALPGGWVATVAHSFDGVKGYSVVGRDADLVYLDLERDVALLWGPPPSDSPALKLASEPIVGSARVVSFPEPDKPAVVSEVEILRLANVTLDGEGRRMGFEMVADINPGDSGSPVVDAEGRLIGIVFASARGVDSGWAVSVTELIGALDVAEREPVTPPSCE